MKAAALSGAQAEQPEVWCPGEAASSLTGITAGAAPDQRGGRSFVA